MLNNKKARFYHDEYDYNRKSIQDQLQITVTHLTFNYHLRKWTELILSTALTQYF